MLTVLAVFRSVMWHLIKADQAVPTTKHDTLELYKWQINFTISGMEFPPKIPRKVSKAAAARILLRSGLKILSILDLTSLL